MSEHTPGPWVWDSERIGTPEGRELLLVGIRVPMTAGPLRDEAKANARLIAAAPDLLSVAKRWAALDGGAWHPERHASEKAELLAATRAAIAKATERTP